MLSDMQLLLVFIIHCFNLLINQMNEDRGRFETAEKSPVL